MEVMLVVAQGIDRFLQVVARLFGWLLVALVVVICWDVLTRKLGFQIPGFGSTPIQELEWHLHGMLFLFEFPQEVAFWMKNTVLSLDLIFIDPAGQVLNIDSGVFFH